MTTKMRANPKQTKIILKSDAIFLSVRCRTIERVSILVKQI